MKMTRISARWTLLGALLAIGAVGCGEPRDDLAGVEVARSAVVSSTLFVSPFGSGTACTQAAPCSLAQAQTNVRGLTAAATGDIVVNLLDGRYQLDSTWSFGLADSGLNGHTVTWEAAPNARPVISGGVLVTGWTDSPTPGIVQATVANANFRQLYVNDVRAPRAGGKVPVTLTPAAQGYTASAATMASFRNPTNIELRYSGANADASVDKKPWTDSRCPIESITGTTIKVAQPCFGNLTIQPGVPYFTTGCTEWGCPSQNTVRIPDRIENVFELLDEPGEWYLDRAVSKLFWKPPVVAGMTPVQVATSSTAIAPVLETLVSLNGTLDAPVHDLVFSGLTFAHATWLRPGTPSGFAEVQANFTKTGVAADGREGTCGVTSPAGTCPFASWTKTPANVTLRAANNVRFLFDTFTHLGGAGLGLELGSSNDLILACTFTDISGNGIQLGGTDDPNPTDSRATLSGNFVLLSYLHDLPVEFLGGVGIFVGYTKTTTIENNAIANTPYSGISIGWGGWARTMGHPDDPLLKNVSRNNLIGQNEISSVMRDLSDGGGIYSNGYRGTSFADGDRYVGNHIHGHFHGGWAIYDDIGSRFVDSEQQIVHDVIASWGGAGPFPDVKFQDGFWTDPTNFLGGFPGAGQQPPPAPASNDLTTMTPVGGSPDAKCEANATCASLLTLVGPRGFEGIYDRNGEVVQIDDLDPSITYKEVASWTKDLTSGLEVINRSRHFTSVNGAFFETTFGGTGFDYLTETDPARGNVSLTVDGVSVGTVNCSSQMLVLNQVCGRVRGLAPGMHTLRATKVDGSFMSLDALRIYSGGPTGKPVDDTGTGFSYLGTSWVALQRNTLGESQGTLHFATGNGDGYVFSFIGTGADVVGDRDSSRGSADVSVDGGPVQRIDPSTSASLSVQQRLFSVRDMAQGLHTIRVTKQGGAFLDVDRVDVFGTTTINDDGPGVSYAGPGWVDSNGRPYGDLNGDVHFTTADGASASLTFTGSGVEVITETNVDRAIADIVVDGVSRGPVFTFAPGLGVQKTVFRQQGLARGAHTITLSKRGGTYMAIDAFNVME